MAWFGLAMLIIATVFGVIDRQIIILVVEPMKRELQLTDLHIGAIQGLGPAMFALLMGFPLAWLADRVNRSALLAVCILFWSLATAMRGFSADFGDLMIATIGIAVGEAVLTPVTYSLIPDLFTDKRRPTANFIYYASLVVGAGIGLMLGGAALGASEWARDYLPGSLAQLSNWRIACLLVAVPGIPIALLVLLIPATRHIQRPSATPEDQGDTPQFGLKDYFRAHWRTVLGSYFAMGCYSFGYGAVAAWLAPAIVRDHQASATEVGLRFGMMFTIGAAVGVTIAMLTVGYWRRVAGRGYVARAIAWTNCLAAVPLIGLLLAANADTAYLLGGLVIVCGVAGAAYSPTLLQDMAPAHLRARVAALSMILYSAIGASGPMAAGALSDFVGPGEGNLTWVIVILAAPAFLLTGVIFGMLEKPLLRLIDDSAARG